MPYAEPCTPKVPRPLPECFRARYVLAILVLGGTALAIGAWYRWLGHVREEIGSELSRQYGIRFNSGDRLISARPTMGKDLDQYYYFELSPATFQSLRDSVRSLGRWKQGKNYIKWPWSLPADAEVYWDDEHGIGAAFVFSASTRRVFYHEWHW
jgi:hypothetical protein